MNPIILIFLLSVLEGLTEFLPISSTGHMIIFGSLFAKGLLSKHFMDNFLVVVQLGPILAVVLYFWPVLNPFTRDPDTLKKRFLLYVKLGVALIPTVIAGLFLENIISDYFMDNVFVVAAALVFYGVLFLIPESALCGKSDLISATENLSWPKAFAIGLFQCLALVPGTSRSGSTILGGLFLGLSKQCAAEFSFLLAIPTMFGATGLKLIKNGLSFSGTEWAFLLFGNVVSFAVAWIVIKWLMAYLKKKSFRIFGVYRIVLGAAVLLFTLFGK